MNHQKKMTSNFQDVILLDTGSFLDLMANCKFAAHVRPSKTLMSMSTNAGHKTVAVEATVPGCGTTWCDEKAIANIFSFANLLDKPDTLWIRCGRCLLGPHQDHWCCKVPSNTRRLACFLSTRSVLQEWDEQQKKKQLLTAAKLDADACAVVGIFDLIDTVEENRMGFSKQQFECAEEAWKLCHGSTNCGELQAHASK